MVRVEDGAPGFRKMSCHLARAAVAVVMVVPRCVARTQQGDEPRRVADDVATMTLVVAERVGVTVGPSTLSGSGASATS